MAGGVYVNVLDPERVAVKGSGCVDWLAFDDGRVTIVTTAARARAMEFAFNNPESVLALIDGQGVAE